MKNQLKHIVIAILIFHSLSCYSQRVSALKKITDPPCPCGHISKHNASSKSLGGKIQGHVYNVDHLPVANAIVRIYCYGKDELFDSTFTNNKGEYNFNNIFGDFLMTVEYIKGAFSLNDFERIKVIAGRTTIVDL